MSYRRTLPILTTVLAALFTLPALAQQRPGPFTQPPRSVRSRTIDQGHVKLDLKFDFEKQQFHGTATHTLKLFQAASEIDLDAAGMKIEKVAARRTKGDPSTPVEVKFRHQSPKLTIELGKEHPADSELEITIDYLVTKPLHGAHFVEPDADEPSQPRMVWTQSEPEYARYWYPCFDYPGDRLTSEIAATVPSKYVTLSNGVVDSKRDNGDGTTTWHWLQKTSHVPYLLSVVAGDFEILEQSWDGIPVQSYVPRGRLADAPRSFEKTPAMVAYFSQKIGHRYPWPKYAQICVDEYGWGGMEHTSATTLNMSTLHDERAHLDQSSDSLVSHELAHQWFGDLLTCKDWGELWLNESFATFFETVWTEHDLGWDQAAWDGQADAEAYQSEDARYRRSIVNYRYNDPEVMFDRHTYPKGGRVLHMLRFELGDEMFWRAIRRYVEINQHRNVETANFRIAIEEATGRGMNWFFDQWLYKGGHPEFNVSWDYDTTAKQLQVTVKQTQKVDDTTPLFRSSVEIEIVTPDQNVTRRVTVSKAEETFHFDVAQRPTRVVFDPKNWVLKKLTFKKSKEELLDQLAHEEQVIPRVQAVQGLAELTDEKDAVAALIRAAKDDRFWGVRQEAVKALAKASGDDVRAALIQSAKSDPKSFVRREALIALQKFPHADTRAAVREVIEKDQSYYAIAEALRCLVKIDREKSRELLLAALDKPSDNEVILRAAVNGLVELNHQTADERITKLLEGKLTPQHRGTLIAGLARLKPDDPAALEKLHAQLDNDRTDVRRAAIEALTTLGTPTSIDKLLARRSREEIPGTRARLDEAVEKLRTRLGQPDALRTELEQLRKQNQQLEERLKKLEKPAQ